MANRIKGITIEIDGNTTPLQKALSGVNKSLSSTNTALRDVNRLLKLNPGNLTLIKQKQDLLKKAIADTSEKLEKEKKALAQLKEADESPEVKAQMEALERQIIDDTNKLEKLQGELDDISPGGVHKLSAALKSAGDKAKELGNKMKSVGNKMSEIGQSMTATVTAPIVAGFTVAGKVASDYEEALNKIDTAFGKNADSVKKFTNTTTEQFGISKAAAAEMTSGFGALAKGIGLSESEAAKMSTSLTGLTGDLASYFNTSQDEAATALESIFTGETEALKKFGIVMNDTNLKQFAADHGLVWKEMSQGEKTMLRYQYVLEKTKDAQGDYARTSDGTANSVKTAKAALEDLALTFGTKVLPIITPMIQKATELVQKFSSLPAPIQEIIVKAALIAAVVGPIILIVGKVISVVGTIMSLIGGLMPAISGLIAAITAIGSPILVVVGVIAGLIAAGVLLAKNWDKIRAKAKELQTAIKEKFQAIRDKISEVWKQVKAKTQNAWNLVKGTVIKKAVEIYTSARNKFNSLRATIAGIWGTVKTNAQTAWNAVKKNIINPVKDAYKTVKNKFTSIRDTIKDKIETARDKVKGAIKKIKGFMNFSWKIPKPKLPKITITIKHKTVGKLSVPYPTFSASYAKAYHQPYLFSQPTMMGGAMFGDRNGDEMVYGRENLMRDISKAAGVDSDKIYNAVREGASAAHITMYVGERELGRVLRDMGVKFA